MKNIFYKIALIIAVIVFAFPLLLRAEMITFEVEGLIVGFDGPHPEPFEVGQTYLARFTFNSDTVGTTIFGGGKNYEGAVTEAIFTIGPAYSGTLDNSTATNICVKNDHFGHTDEYVVTLDSVDAPPIQTPISGLVAPSQLALIYLDDYQPPDGLSSNDLPLIPPDLTMFEGHSWWLEFESPSYYGRVRGSISTIAVKFADVPPGHWAEDAIYKLYNAGITKGCSSDPLMYCPDRTVSKASMAVFLLRSLHGGDYSPPAATGIFTDVDLNQWFAPWVEQLYREGITQGCSSNPLMYCPHRDVSKKSMAVFLLRVIYGANYTPPPATGIFTDVPINDWFAPWIEQLYREGITRGCSSDPLMYCPNRAVSKAAMALFLVRAFGL